jgi:hypothetical protein
LFLVIIGVKQKVAFLLMHVRKLHEHFLFCIFVTVYWVNLDVAALPGLKPSVPFQCDDQLEDNFPLALKR